jgi:hypothetical protein
MNSLTQKEIDLIQYVADLFGQEAAESQRDLILTTKKAKALRSQEGQR